MSKSKKLFMENREEESQKYTRVEFEYHYNLWADKGGVDDSEYGADIDHQEIKITNLGVDDIN